MLKIQIHINYVNVYIKRERESTWCFRDKNGHGFVRKEFKEKKTLTYERERESSVNVLKVKE